MANNTRVNELQEKLLNAIDILNAKALGTVKYDKTIVCKIEDDQFSKDGKYEVSDGSRIFTAYSSDTRLKAGTDVYITVPEGNYENQKIILGKKTSESEKPFIYTTPFDDFFDMTGNLAVEASSGELIANDIDNFKTEDNQIIPLEECWSKQEIFNKNFTEEDDLVGYSRFAVRADFRSWVKNATKGNYGLDIIISSIFPNITTGEPENGTYTYRWDSSTMYGNPYSFETYYSQELVLDLKQMNIGRITNITINFYQDANFYNRFNEPIKSTENGYLLHSSNNEYQRYGDKVDENGNIISRGIGYFKTDSKDTKLASNLFVKNLEVYCGYDISTFGTDFVEIYTQNTDSYKRSTEVDGEETQKIKNQKEIKMRWIHINNGVPINMTSTTNENKPEIKYEVRWYKYSVGAAAADQYCGIYWERLDDATGFNYIFNPDINKQQERIKAIVVIEDNAYYRSNEIIFENEENLPPSQEAQHIMNALVITTDDETNGNYMIYGQDNSIKDTEYGKITRTLSAWFDADNNGEINTETEKILDYDNLIWQFPTENTMIKLLNGGTYEIIELIPYIANTYWIKNEQGQFVLDSNSEINSSYQYYSQINEEQYIEINNLYKPGYYYLNTYISCSNKEFDNTVIYYQLDEETQQYQPIRNLDLKQFNDFKDKLYILEYVIDNSKELDSENKIYYIYNNNNGIVQGMIPQYKIENYYSPTKSNNTISCQYILNGVVYTSEKEFTFGPAGTMGTDQTLIIDFVGDMNAVNKQNTDENIRFEIQLYDNQNKQQTIPDGQVEWAWYYNTDLIGANFPININQTNSVLLLPAKDFNIDSLYILQATVGDLTTYFPVPVQAGGYSYITGPTQVIYQSNGEPFYNRETYKLYQPGDVLTPNVYWEIKTDSYQFVGTLTQEEFDAEKYYIKNGNIYSLATSYNSENQYYIEVETKYTGEIKYNEYSNSYTLNPIPIYVEDASIYGVQAKNGDNIIWTQPILVLKNLWPNGVINAWNGKDLVLDEENSTILSAAISAGKKNSDNTFSGVMIGDWKGQDVAGDITEQTGVYGFHHGAMSYAFKEDGTAFLGKDGRGRIYIDGNNATLYSAEWKSDLSGTGMEIDLDAPYIKMSKGSTNRAIILDATKNGGIDEADDNRAPFKIGTKFAIDWDGTLYAESGNFTGTISASTLQSDEGGITLDGYFNIPTTGKGLECYFGSISSGIPGIYAENEKAGIGMSAGTNLGIVKATRINAGIGFGNNYMSVTDSTVSMGNDNGKQIAISSNSLSLNCRNTKDKKTYYFKISDDNEDAPTLYTDIPAANQFGIYARFA